MGEQTTCSPILVIIHILRNLVEQVHFKNRWNLTFLFSVFNPNFPS